MHICQSTQSCVARTCRGGSRSDEIIGRIILSQSRFLRKFYKLFTKYKEDPNENRKIYIKRRFNSLFSTKTGYGELDTQVALTEKKEAELLLVLDHPHAQYCVGFPDPILQNRYREPVS